MARVHAGVLGGREVWLQQGRAKEIQECEQVVVRLQAEWTKLHRRIEANLTAEIERQQRSRLAYVDNLAELASRAAGLFEQQPASEKRKLLRYLVEECR